MAENFYTLPESPVYQELIRRLRNDDPVDADAVVNPLIEALLENIHYLYLRQKNGGGRTVLATRVRDPTKPTYGLDVREDGTVAVTLEAAAYTGTAEISVIVSGEEYDAENMSANEAEGLDGTLILKQMEE